MANGSLQGIRIGRPNIKQDMTKEMEALVSKLKKLNSTDSTKKMEKEIVLLKKEISNLKLELKKLKTKK